MPIRYLTGDATEPEWRPTVIAHIVNNRGGFGRGFAATVAKKWPYVRSDYTKFHAMGAQLGDIQIIGIEGQAELSICNIMAQDGYISDSNPCPFNHLAAQKGLTKLSELIRSMFTYSSAPTYISMPRIGAGLGGAKWEDVEQVILAATEPYEVPVDVYDLPGN